MKDLQNIKTAYNLPKLQTTLFEVALRDSANNSDLYRDSEIIQELTAIHHILEMIANSDRPATKE